MKLKPVSGVVAASILAFAACSGNFATGTGLPQTNPVGPQPGAQGSMAPYDKNGLPINGSAKPSSSPGATSSGVYSVTEAQNGFACPPTVDGYGCTLKFNLAPPTPTPAPTPKGKKAKATPAPTPTPSPTPTPAPSASGSTSPKPTPTPGTIALKAEALPKDAPALVHTPPGTLDTVPLMMVHLSLGGPMTLDGWAQANFTVPKSQLGERGFAVQLFRANIGKRKTTYDPIWTFDKSTLNDTTLTFSFAPPKTELPKGSIFVLVLYGDDKSKTTSPAPLATGSTAASGAPSTAAPASAAPSVKPSTEP